MFYSTDAPATRAFVRDRLGVAAHDGREGWLIFDVPEAEVGRLPVERSAHDLSFHCDDVAATVRELEGRGVVFRAPIEDRGYGLVTRFELPGVGPVQLYRPRDDRG